MSSLTRRRFLAHTTATCGAGALLATPVAADLTDTSLRCEDFEPLVGSQFRIQAGEQEGSVKLTEAAIDNPTWRPVGVRQEPFRLTFRGSQQDRFDQATYRVSHPQFGSLWMLLVPTRDEHGEPIYEAIFA